MTTSLDPSHDSRVSDREHAAPGPIRITAEGAARLRLRPAVTAEITGGLWAERRRINREVSVPQGWDRLQEAGNLHNLELAAGRAEGAYVNDLPFLDSDLYKWAEAVGWTLTDPSLGSALTEQLLARLASTEDLLRAAQEPDGYLDSHFQVRFPGERFVQLDWGHELYCAGHLIQAAIAVHRGIGDTDLLDIARRVADLIVQSFGTEAGRVDGVCGHPEIETALVELYRETGEQSYLDRARYFVDRRGHGLLGGGRFGRAYWQDHRPVRDAPSVEGHAVRQLYLLAGVADLYVEDGDPTLLAACERMWAEMMATKTYLTGGIGAHHKDEAFGDPYELPNERSYCETCAAIASIMLAWRLLQITGAARYADLLERTLYNGFLAGISLDGQRYIYANPLQVRDGHANRGDDGDYERRTWFRCACCPPNVMRLLASLEHYAVLGGEALTVHQYVSGHFAAAVGDGIAAVDVETTYPWDATVTIRVVDGPETPWGLRVRVPDWANGVSVRINADPVEVVTVDGWGTIERAWTAGDTVELVLGTRPRFTTAHPRVDAARGAAAIEHGPLVYCLETVDQTGDRLDDLLVDLSTPPVVGAPIADLDGAVAITAAGSVVAPGTETWWPYTETGRARPNSSAPVELTAVPYYAWGNREPGAMRIWIPTV